MGRQCRSAADGWPVIGWIERPVGPAEQRLVPAGDAPTPGDPPRHPGRSVTGHGCRSGPIQLPALRLWARVRHQVHAGRVSALHHGCGRLADRHLGSTSSDSSASQASRSSQPSSPHPTSTRWSGRPTLGCAIARAPTTRSTQSMPSSGKPGMIRRSTRSASSRSLPGRASASCSDASASTLAWARSGSSSGHDSTTPSSS